MNLWQPVTNGEDSLVSCQECGTLVDKGYDYMEEPYFICEECYSEFYSEEDK